MVGVSLDEDKPPMKAPRWTIRVAAALTVLCAGAATLSAQGITTGAVAGQITDEAGRPLADVQVVVRNAATGFQTGSFSRNDGRYRVQNIEPGAGYTVTARRIGLQAVVKENQVIPLSNTLNLDFKMSASVAQITGVQVVATATPEVFSPSNQGTKTTVSDTVIQRMPTLSRNLTDFIKLTPQAAATGPGFSGGGMSNRMNNVQIDGASDRDVFGLGSTGQPGAEVNAKSVSIDAVKEFQVLLAPFDVRQGNFGGLLLNAITKGGTNDWRGTVYRYFRNQDYGADTPAVRGTKFNRAQTGFTLGGPIIRDKLHFFVAPEWQTENSPVTGPYFNQPTTFAQKFSLSQDQLTRFETAYASLTQKPAGDVGTAGAENIKNPLTNVFTRFDYALNETHRMVFRFNYSDGERLRQQNNRGTTAVVYSSNFHNFRNVKTAPVLQLFSNFKSGASNELFVGYNKWFNRRNPLSQAPQIRVNSVTGVNGTTSILAGADQFSQGNQLDTKTWELTENYTFRPVGNHTFTLGTRNEYVWLRNLFTQSSFGVWSFRDLDSLAAGNANSFRKAIVLSEGGNVYFSALQNAFYAQDQWNATSRLSITGGLRFDLSTYLKDVAYNAAIDSAYHRRTDAIPSHSLQFSPRVGFNWDVTGDQHNQVRGGIGLFVGTPPYVWLENAYVNSGNVITFLNCNTNGSTATAPAFTLNPSSINTCRNGQGTKPIGDVNFLADGLKFPQPMRATLAYDRQLPWNLVATFEGLYSKTLNQLFFVSKNVQAPTGTDLRGRVIYINKVSAANGADSLLPPPSVLANGGTARFSTAIDLQNQNKDYAYNLTAQLRRRFINNWEGTVAYTYSRARDVQSFTSSTAISNWQFGRTLSGRQEDAFTTISLFDQPHKFLGVLTRSFEFVRNWGTDVTMIYTGTSGAPHDYIYGGSSGAGDLNGDGVQGNDLFYVPKSALDPTEIQFRASGANTPAAQAQALENFIQNSKCLSKQRGQILARNSCRNPFQHIVDLSLRQNLPTLRGQRLALDVDVFNFGNLLNKNWGKQPITPTTSNSNVPLVTHVGYSSTDPKSAVPIVTFTAPSGGEYATSSNFSGNFWRTQVALRYSF
jgi:hypothetical protein